MTGGPWALFGVALSAALVIATPFVWRARGAVWGLRWLAVAIVPAGLAFTGLFTLVARVSSAVSSFFTRSAFSPTVWLGYVLIGVAVVVWLVAGAVSSRRRGRTPAEPQPQKKSIGTTRASINSSAGAAPSADDEFADVEAILRRRGI